MMIISSLEQLNNQWLTEILAHRPAKLNGTVSHFEILPHSGTTSKIARLKISYAQGSTGDLPVNLLLKICQNSDFTSPSEVYYYSRDYISLKDAPIPKCYHAAYSPQNKNYHLLLEDLTATHSNNFEIKPTLKYGQAVAEALAKLHAQWWGINRLKEYGTHIPTVTDIDTYLANVRPGLEPLIAATATDIDPEWHATLRRVFAVHPAKMLARTANPQGFTVVHGDVNPGNVLSHLQNITPVYIIDRQPFDWSLTSWLGVSDIAYMMVHWWDTEIRRNLEFEVLRSYHQSLLQNGVANYSWEQLIYDYKLCAIQSLYVATNWCISDEERVEMRWVWYPQLIKAMTAFYDLNCSALLD